MNRIVAYLLWPVIAIAGAFSFAALALGRGESVNAVWLVTAAVTVYLIAYRFYSKYIAERVLQLRLAGEGVDHRLDLAGRHPGEVRDGDELVAPALRLEVCQHRRGEQLG